MKVKIDRENDRAVVHLPKKIAPEDTAEFSSKLVQLGADGVKKIILDLQLTEMLDSSALGALIFARKNIQKDKAEIILYKTTPYVKQILENAKLNTMFKFVEEESAL